MDILITALFGLLIFSCLAFFIWDYKLTSDINKHRIKNWEEHERWMGEVYREMEENERRKKLKEKYRHRRGSSRRVL